METIYTSIFQTLSILKQTPTSKQTETLDNNSKEREKDLNKPKVN